MEAQVLDLPRPARSNVQLRIYLLGEVDLDAAACLQRRLVYEVSGDRNQAALILCEHPPTVSIGREGSSTHIQLDGRELYWRRMTVRWVNRGGGCLLHMPGQLAIYPILPLNRLRLSVPAYMQRLQQVAIDVADDFMLRADHRTNKPGVWMGNRLLAHVGIAVRDWVSYFGLSLNVNVDLDLFRKVNVAGHTQAMTSIERERRLAVNPELVRQRVLEHLLERFGFEKPTLYHHHPALAGRGSADALVAPGA
jgi:lipoyl(octanoyl) transferase